MISFMTRIEGAPDRDYLNPGMAHFPGTGPVGATCGQCQHLGYSRINRNGRTVREAKGCAVYKKLTGRTGEPVEKTYPACKYFAPRTNR